MSIVLNGTTGITTPDLDSSDLTVTKAGTPIIADRTGSNGTILDLKKDGSTVGSIGSRAGVSSYIALDPRTNGVSLHGVGQQLRPGDETGALEDATIDLGGASQRFKDLHLSGKTHSQIIGDGEAGLLFNSGTQDGVLPYNLTAGTLDARGTTDIGASGFKFKDLYLSGGVYLGGTGAANKLDDYEEGTWTPAIILGGLSVNVSHRATYVKVGSSVHITAYFTVNGTGNTGHLRIGHLPFSSPSNGYSVGGIDFQVGGKAGAYNRITSSNNFLEVLYSGDSPSVTRLNLEGGQVGHGYVILSLTYSIA